MTSTDAATSDVPTYDFDHHSAEHAASSGEINRELHDVGPVAWSPNYGGFWLVNGYDQVSSIEKDNATFSSEHDMTGDGSGYEGIVIPPQPFKAVPIEVDPPEFFGIRKLLAAYFSPGASERYRPFLEQAVDWALDRISETGEGDLVLDLANPVPGLLTCAILGLPLEDWERYAAPAHQIVYAPPGSDVQQDATMAAIGMMQDIYAAVLDRRENPADDLISQLTHADIDGEPLSDQTVTEIVFLIIFGGVDTTTGLTANALHWLSANRDHLELLQAEPDRWQKATEEFLRYFTPVQGMARTVTGDTEVAGCPMAAGDRVQLNFGAANRDPEKFEAPQDIDLERFPNRHMAFGLGIHRCLGSNIARVMFRTMCEGVLRRMPDYRVDENGSKRYQTIGTVNGWEKMPATFTPTPSTGTGLPERPGLLTAKSKKGEDEPDDR